MYIPTIMVSFATVKLEILDINGNINKLNRFLFSSVHRENLMKTCLKICINKKSKLFQVQQNIND
jgi:hypothetical protein